MFDRSDYLRIAADQIFERLCIENVSMSRTQGSVEFWGAAAGGGGGGCLLAVTRENSFILNILGNKKKLVFFFSLPA